MKVRLLVLSLLLAVCSVIRAKSNVAEIAPAPMEVTQSLPTKAKCMSILEQFCQNFYSKCFPERLYVEGSLRIEAPKYEDREKGSVKVEGTHSYQGRNRPFLGRRSYTGIDFYAIITPLGYGEWEIEFHKLYAPDYPGGPTHWEVCTKRFIPE